MFVEGPVTVFKWVAKESLFAVPFVGWSMTLARHIRLTRGDFSSIKRVYREAAGWLRQGMSVLFFPEGTRNPTDEMKDFQNGAFKLAIKEGVPVLPIAIRGTGDMIPKGSWLFKTMVPGSIIVLPAIDTGRFKGADFALLRDRARKALVEKLRSDSGLIDLVLTTVTMTVGAPGLEIWGPYEDKHYIHSPILQAARDVRFRLTIC